MKLKPTEFNEVLSQLQLPRSCEDEISTLEEYVLVKVKRSAYSFSFILLLTGYEELKSTPLVLAEANEIKQRTKQNPKNRTIQQFLQDSSDDEDEEDERFHGQLCWRLDGHAQKS